MLPRMSTAALAPPPAHREPFWRRNLFIAGLGIGQIISWGTLYYSFPLIAEPMGKELALSKTEVYGAATLGLVVTGLAAYPIGAAIDRGRGRGVMTWGSVLGGLLLIAWSRVGNLGVFYLLFAGIGLVQAMTLYDPAFAVVARRFGKDARSGITNLTLWGGFASTVFVPLLQALLNNLGWRNALLVLGACNLAVCIALHAVIINPAADDPDAAQPKGAAGGASQARGRLAVRWVLAKPAFWGLLASFTLYYGIFVGLTFHLYPLLLERGLTTATVVSAIAIVGPSQVAGRIAIWMFGARGSMRVIGSLTVLVLPCVLLFLLLLPPGFGPLAAFAAAYGAMNGVMTIVRGLAVPEMITREAYGAINGLLAAPGNVAKAIAPVSVAWLWAAAGSYHAVLVVGLACSGVVVAGFWFAAWKSKDTAL